MKKLSLQVALIVLVSIAALSVANAAPSIEGYSPVAYFTENQAIKGDPGYTAEHDGRTYYFQNPDEVEIFKADPEKYAPKFPICAYSLALGERMPIDPTNFQIVGGQLLLFHRSDDIDGLALFQESELTDSELLQRAEREYQLLGF